MINGTQHRHSRRGGFSLKSIIHDVEVREGRDFSHPESRPLPHYQAVRPPSRGMSYSLSKIIQDVAERTGCPVAVPEPPGEQAPGQTPFPSERRPPVASGGRSSTMEALAPVPKALPAHDVVVLHQRREGPRHPRATHQVTLEGHRAMRASTLDKFSRQRPLSQPASSHSKGAGRAPGDRTAPFPAEHPSPREEDNLAGPEDTPRPPQSGQCGRDTPAVLSLLPRIHDLADESFMLLYLGASREFEMRFGAPGWCDEVLTMAARGR